jgi:hypothetical protein
MALLGIPPATDSLLRPDISSSTHFSSAQRGKTRRPQCENILHLRNCMNEALIERYRCPEEFLHLDLIGPLSGDTGYFRFGQSTICYGTSASGFRTSRADDLLYDTGEDVKVNGSKLHLPFDPSEIINNLRLERYTNHQGQNIFNRWKRSLKSTYYWLRPMMHLHVRKRIQRVHLNGWRNLFFPRWPVDTTVENLCEQLLLLSMKARGVDAVPFIWFWPDGAHGCVTVTHDIETEKGLNFCSELMDTDQAFGIKASIQVVPEGRYKISDAFIQDIRNRRFELNIQDLNHDGHLYRDREEFLRRARRINEYAKLYDAEGFRAAVLYRNLDWYDALQFSYDMSVPNVAHLDPQRGGCCTVMPYFVGEMLEIPLTTTQDYMLFHLLNDYSLDLWKAQTELILQRNGLASFIIHPDYVIEKRARGIYRELLSFLHHLRSSAGIWFALPTEIDCWWRERRRMRVVNRDGQWMIEGKGAERAKLAFARIIRDRLEYEVPASTNRVL